MVELRSGVDASLTLGRSLRAISQGLEKLVSYEGKYKSAPLGIARNETAMQFKGKG